MKDYVIKPHINRIDRQVSNNIPLLYAYFNGYLLVYLVMKMMRLSL